MGGAQAGSHISGLNCEASVRSGSAASCPDPEWLQRAAQNSARDALPGDGER